MLMTAFTILDIVLCKSKRTAIARSCEVTREDSRFTTPEHDLTPIGLDSLRISSLTNGRGSWVVGTSRGSWVWVWVWVWVSV